MTLKSLGSLGSAADIVGGYKRVRADNRPRNHYESLRLLPSGKSLGDDERTAADEEHILWRENPAGAGDSLGDARRGLAVQT